MQNMSVVRRRLNSKYSYDQVKTATMTIVALVWGLIILATMPREVNDSSLSLLAIRSIALALFFVFMLLASLFLEKSTESKKAKIFAAICIVCAVLCPVVTVFTYILL